MQRLLWISIMLVASALFAAPTDVASLRLVPFPKEVSWQTGQFRLGRSLTLEAPSDAASPLLESLNDELRRAGFTAAQVRRRDDLGQSFRLSTAVSEVRALAAPDRSGSAEAYALDIGPHAVVGAAWEPAGLHFAMQTLRQLIRANRRGDTLPALQIRDWPSLRWRAFQDDLTRGPSSRLETLRFEASLGSYLKFNLLTYYMEYQYAFRKHPKIGPPDGSLTPEELAALVAFARPLHLEIMGNQQSFGHFGRILRHPEYAALRETEDLLTPVREESYQLLDDLYSEVCPRLPFPFFNVCCDETWGLGTGLSRELAAQIGVGGVYVRHLRRVRDLLRDKYGKRMMMWGDIILQHPERLADLPRDTIMLTWGYDARDSFEDQIVPFAKSAFEFFVCPGVNNWSRILPDFGVAVTNIQHFVRDGVKHGALGMINTDWEDDGEALNAVKWHADAWAAECAWNAATTSFEAFSRRVGAVLFGETGNEFGRAVELLARTHRQPAMMGMFNSRFWKDDFIPRSSTNAVQQAASNLLAVVRPARAHLEACQREATANQAVLEAMLFGARRMEQIGQRTLDGLMAARLYEQAYAAAEESPARKSAAMQSLSQAQEIVRRNREAHADLGRQFASLWLAESKPYALDWTLTRYTNTVAAYTRLEQRLAGARAAAEAGRPLPCPEEMGLAIPKPVSRVIRLRAFEPTPLSPETTWAVPEAAYRLGITVDAGAADRVGLPVEVELPLSGQLAGRPVRAFQLAPPSAPLEVSAQVDILDTPARSRLVLVLPGLLAKGTRREAHVYLGLAAAPPSPAGSVQTHATRDGLAWLENDRVRLLLGTEGAHIYRWEVKEPENRDLTMPGSAGWAGFSDVAPQRSAPHRLDCTGRGPAMVEYQCREPAGDTKTVRLYAGACWVEVFLSEPTTIYWDFDDPRNFAADGPSPGTWWFSDGQTGRVGRQADGVAAQVKAVDVYWGVKASDPGLALGLITPEVRAHHHIAPGAGAGGVGIENSAPALHFVTFAGRLNAPAPLAMEQLHGTLDLTRPVEVRVHALQAR